MADCDYSSSFVSAAIIGFTQAIFPVREDDGQVAICVEISDLLEATEVNLTVTLDAVSSDKAGREGLECFVYNLMKFRLPLN